jgi:transposase
MIVIPPNAKIYVAVEPIDFRNGIGGLGRICRDIFKKDPMGGAYFVFKNKKRMSIKILIYDGGAFWLLTRRLSRGKIKWWPKASKSPHPLTSKELQTLLFNGNPENAEFTDDWKKLIT